MITAGLCRSFKAELFQAIHDFENDTFKLALYVEAAELDPTTLTTYTATGEVTATGYTAGGVVLMDAAVSQDGAQAIVDFADTAVPGTDMTFRGGVIYNSSKANRAVCVLDFGYQEAPQTDPVIYMPTPVADIGLIRI